MDLHALLRCPACHGHLAWSHGAASCELGHAYAVVDGIPILLPPASRTAYKEQQANGHDRKAPELEEWELSRPACGPLYHGFLMTEKYRRSVLGLEDLLPGGVVVTSCSGGGMDAEMLARAGAQVIATEISLGCVQRIKARAERTGLPILAVVADAEALPLEDGSVDVGYVHDGLHHLEDPYVGAAELCRVATRGVSINEPAVAASSRIAVRVGAAEAEEEYGNLVGRMDPQRTASVLAAHGFAPVRPHRYGMFYRHIPGTPSRVLSRRALFPLARRGFLAANQVAGDLLGNKMAVQGRRGVPSA